MAEQNISVQVCQNGHRQPDAGSRFCIYCGTPITTSDAPPSPPQQVIQPVVQPPANQAPPAPINPGALAPQPNNFQPARPVNAPVFIKACITCGGHGRTLDQRILVCKECKWLRPLSENYGIDPSAFQWAEDGRAMSVLRSIKPLTMAAQSISDKVGRRWIETLFNGVRLSENQLPEVYYQAVRAARTLGMTYMPDVYVSGEYMWDCRTYGSDKDSFIVMGSALATNFRGPELLFLFAREMGHCRTGHALWKTVIKFLMGEQGPRKGLMGGGLFASLSPTALLEGTLEMPLLAWARQAEITADRAGMLVVGDEEIVRRVLLTWSLKSPILYRQVKVEEWLAQQAESDDDMTKLSELMTSATPYITRRLKLVEKFGLSPELSRWQVIIKDCEDKEKAQKKREQQNDIRLKCASCGAAMRIPAKILEGKSQMSIRCPDAKCGKMTYIKKNAGLAPAGKALKKQMETNLSYDE